MTPDNKRQGICNCDNPKPGVSSCMNCFQDIEDQGREDASAEDTRDESDFPPYKYKKDTQPTQAERREFWLLGAKNRYSGWRWYAREAKGDEKYFPKQNSKWLIDKVFKVREIGNGLIPVEDVRPLLDAINSFNKAKWVFDDNWRKTEDAQKLYRAFNEFFAKHPGLK